MSIEHRSSPIVEIFFHEDTNTFSYIVHEGDGRSAAIIDPVLDYEPASARVQTLFADRLLAFVTEHQLKVEWILETHAHADHLSAGSYLRDVLGAKLAIGRGIVNVQTHFKRVFGLGDEFVADGRQFDHLFEDDETFVIGEMAARVLATPGHTDDSLTYLVGDAAFVGDTVFAADTGTARADFPGGSAHQLYASIQKILSLPESMRIFLCHDYPKAGRGPIAETSIAIQARTNIHLAGGISEAGFVAMRIARDATLSVPRLIYPALQVNIRGGRLPPGDADGVSYLRLPINRIGDTK